MIEIRHLRKEYQDVTPLKDVSVTIYDGDVISIIGPSGTGKSTLIRCLNLLETPSGGQIFLNGEEITARRYDVRKARRQMGMVFQSFNLFGHLTVIENLTIAPMDLLKKSRKEAYEKGMEILERVGVADKALSYPDELSGGQKQRVAIARTLCMDPEVILLDEPTSALDPTMIAEVQAVIRELARSGKTMLIVTHEMTFARAISNRVFYMDEGGIYEEGSPEQIFDHPQRENTRRFIRKLRVFETRIDSRIYDFIRMGAELDTYLLQNDVPSALRYRIRLAIEELVQQILLPHLKNPRMQLVVEYSLQDGSAHLTVTYGGDAWDIRETDNELSLKMLESTAQEITWQWDEGEEEQNRVEIELRTTGDVF